MKGRIIVVEDLKDVSSTIKGKLEDEGYIVKTAASRDDAIRLLQGERFHVAVLDIRLEESDDSNEDGIQLLQDITSLDPLIASIVLTGHSTNDTALAALRRKNGFSPAYDYLEKEKNGFTLLPDKVYSAFNDFLNLNLNLTIDDYDNCIEKLASNMRFTSGNKPDKTDILEQINEIFSKLFFECDQISVGLIEQGFSGAVVFQVTPSFPGRGLGQNVIVKIGDRSEIRAEHEHYEKYVRGIVGGHRVPEAIKFNETRHVGGIRYSFVGMDETSVNFSKFYLKSETKDILEVIDNLYKDTLFPLKQNTGQLRLRPNCDLMEFYKGYLHLDEKKLQKVEERTTGSKHIFEKGAQGEILLHGKPIINPIQYFKEANFHLDSFFNTIHGDLNGQNILIDKHQNTWLIDFTTTIDDGHILQDYATLENNIRFNLVSSEDVDLLFRWTKSCINDKLVDLSLPTDLQDRPEIIKSNQAIQRIRKFASETPHFTPRAYLIAVFFNALRLSTFNDVPRMVRDHAFYCASLIAERFSKGAASV